MGADDDQRVTAFSVQLRRAHQQLRDQLAALQADLGRTGGPASLTVHCLAFCAALTTHHQGEDDGMFGALLRARPDLAPAVGKLREDHAAMAGLLGEARALAERARTAPAESLPALRRQLDGLTAITESHFRYEERAIGAALDEGLADTGWSVPVFTPGRPSARGSLRDTPSVSPDRDSAGVNDCSADDFGSVP